MDQGTEPLFAQLLRIVAEQALHSSALDRALDELVRALASGLPLAETLALAASEKWRDDQEISSRLRRWAALGNPVLAEPVPGVGPRPSER